MEVTISPVHDDQMEPGVNRIPAIALVEGDRQELSFAVALLEDTILSLGNGDDPLQLQAAEWHESDNYQVALVPIRNKADRAGKNSRAPLGGQELSGTSRDEARPRAAVNLERTRGASGCGSWPFGLRAGKRSCSVWRGFR